MQFTFNRIDLQKSQMKQGSYGDVLDKASPSEIWYVPYSPIHFDKPIDWRVSSRGERVHIPLFSYFVSDQPVDAFGFAVQLGMRAMRELRDKECKRVHLSLGVPAESVEVDGIAMWQFHIGLGVLT